MTGDTILETRGLTKEFRGFVAVDHVSLAVRRGAIHALIGPNGAGKTTTFNGLDITRARPADVARRGVIRSFQISAVFPNLTVLENVRIALQRTVGTSFHFWKREKTLEVLNSRAMQLLEQVGLEGFAQVNAGELAYGRKRTLEIATTLAMEPELMLLDEPTAGMGHEEVAVGRTVLMVEHNMSVVSGICDTITVLQRGAVLAEGSYAEVSANPQVMEAYMGTAHA
jgi:branched-chain amino acid transport system ATP-binding protein